VEFGLVVVDVLVEVLVVVVGYCAVVFCVPLMTPPVNMFTALSMLEVPSELLEPQLCKIPAKRMPVDRIAMLFFMVISFF